MAKAKTVTARVAVIYNDKGGYQAGGYSTRRCLDDAELIEDARDVAPGSLKYSPHACIVEVELPIPEPLVGTVIEVKAVTR